MPGSVFHEACDAPPPGLIPVKVSKALLLLTPMVHPSFLTLRTFTFGPSFA